MSKVNTLRDLANVGKVLEAHLVAIGITTPEALYEAGYEKVFLKIKEQRDPGICIQMLYGIEGAIEGIPYTQLSTIRKAELKAFYYLQSKHNCV